MSDVIVGSVGVQLVPSAEGFAPKAKSLLQGLTAEVVLKPNTDLFRAELEDATRTRAVTVNVDADTAAAEAKIDAVARNRSADINVNTDGLAKASAESSSLGGGFGTLIGLAGVFGSALVPIGGALAGITATAGVAAKAVLDVEKTQKKIDQLRATAAATTSKKTAAAATAQADYLEGTFNRTQKSFLGAQSALGGAFNALLSQVGPALFAPLTAGLRLAAQILPALAPVIRQVAGYFGELIGHLSADVKGGGFAKFLGYIQSVFPRVMSFFEALGSALGNLFVGLAPAGIALLGLLTQVFDLLAKMPAQVIAPLVAALVGLFGGPELAAIAGIAVALLNLYQSSETVRNALNSFGTEVATNLAPVLSALKGLWDAMVPVLQILGGAIAIVVGALITFWSKVAGLVLPIIIKIDTVIMRIVAPALRFLASAFLAVVGSIVHGAASAFGWVPLLGGKLKGAASDFDAFAASVNASLDGITGEKTINIRVEIFRRITEAVIGPAAIKTGTDLVTGAVKGGGKPTPPKTTTFGGGGGFNAPKSGGGGGAHKPKAKVNSAAKTARGLLVKLAQGIVTGGTQLTSALNGILSNIADFPKKFRERLRTVAKDALAQISKIKTLQTAMADLAKSIKQAFDPANLFDGTIGALRGGLAKALVNVTQAAAAQKALMAAGVSAAFVASLLASGNGKLATQLAADPALAKDFSAQYTAIQQAATALGTSAAGAQFNPQIDATNAELKKQTDLLKGLGPEIGKVINRSVPKGRGHK